MSTRPFTLFAAAIFISTMYSAIAQAPPARHGAIIAVTTIYTKDPLIALRLR